MDKNDAKIQHASSSFNLIKLDDIDLHSISSTVLQQFDNFATDVTLLWCQYYVLN